MRQKQCKKTTDIAYKSDWQPEGEGGDGAYSRRLGKDWVSMNNAQSNPNLTALSTWDKEKKRKQMWRS